MLIFQLGLIGLFAGFVGGLVGIGGSIIMIPAMTEVLGPNQHLYQSAAMIVNFFVVVPAVFQHRRAKAVDGGTVRRLIPIAVVSVFVGVLLSEVELFADAGESRLRFLFGLFLMAIACYDILRLLRRATSNSTSIAAPESTAADQTRWSTACLVAIPTGVVAGLFGVGGGIIAVPLQQRFLHIPMRQAVANSATVIVATSVVGAVVKNYAYLMEHSGSSQAFMLAAILIPTAILGSLAGSRLTHRLPLRIIKTVFFVVLVVAAVRMTVKAASPKPGGDVVGYRVSSPAETSTSQQFFG